MKRNNLNSVLDLQFSSEHSYWENNCQKITIYLISVTLWSNFVNLLVVFGNVRVTFGHLRNILFGPQWSSETLRRCMTDFDAMETKGVLCRAIGTLAHAHDVNNVSTLPLASKKSKGPSGVVHLYVNLNNKMIIINQH